MSRDDYISKLFIDNQDKLEQAPSDDFWSKLEAKLETEMPIEQQAEAPPAKIFRLSRFVAAASVLLAVVGSTYLFRMATDLQNHDAHASIDLKLEEPMALLTDIEEEAEPEPYEDAEVLPAKVVEEVKVAEDKAQEEKLVIALNEAVKENSTLSAVKTEEIKLEEVAIKDKVDEFSLITLETEPEPDPAALGSSSLVGGDDEIKEQNLNYSNYNNVAQQMNNSVSVEEVLSKAKNEKVARATTSSRASSKDVPSMKKEEMSKKKRGNRSKILGPSKGKTQRIKSPMAAAHGRLQPFGFLLGRWVDNNSELEGTSYETWSLKNSTTLVGKGFKLSKQGDRLFEEMMRIEFRNNQVFLVISIEENNHSMDYMLSSFDNERFIFKQKSNKDFPDKVVIQKSIDGYSVIIMNDEDFLTPDQLRYLHNRNRVSNVRSIRDMSYDD